MFSSPEIEMETFMHRFQVFNTLTKFWQKWLCLNSECESVVLYHYEVGSATPIRFPVKQYVALLFFLFLCWYGRLKEKGAEVTVRLLNL